MGNSRKGLRFLGSMVGHRVVILSAGALSVLGLTACASSTANAPESNVAEESSPPAQGGSNYRFTPRAHEPHSLSAPPPPPAQGTLPAFIDGSVECFGSATESQGQPVIDPDSTRGLQVGASASVAGRLSASGRADLQAELKAKASLDVSAYASASFQPGKVETGMQAATDKDRKTQDRSQETHVYLSNDDTMSLSSAQRLIYAIEEFAPISPEEIRPHEFLNYSTFETAPLEPDYDFSVLPRVALQPDHGDQWTLGLSVSGRTLTRAQRRNANLAFVLDRSGSMSQEGRIEFVRRGMQQALSQVKDGDILHLTLFDTEVCQLAQNFVVGRDSLHHLRYMAQRIAPTGSTDLDAGLRKGYEVADAAYRPNYGNRVLLITDALTNTGRTDEDLIALVGKHYDDRRIRLSGIGVGRSFNDSLLDELTERGKGAYVFLGKGEEVDRVLGEGFTSLIEPIATDVHFILHLPPSLKMKTFYGEEASLAKEKVQAIHYFSGTKQMFLVDVESTEGRFPSTDDIMFTVEYTHPDSGQSRVEEFAYRLGDIAQPSASLNKAHLVSLFARELTKLAERPVPPSTRRAPESWQDPEAFRICLDVRGRLERLAKPLSGDDEVHKIRVLWDTYCRRYMLVDMDTPDGATSSSSDSASAPQGTSSSTRGSESQSSSPSRPTPSAPPTSNQTGGTRSNRNNEFAPD